MEKMEVQAMEGNPKRANEIKAIKRCLLITITDNHFVYKMDV